MPTHREAHKILVVDDEEPILFAFREFFGAYGYEVDCARELEEALAMLSSIRYDLIIADLRLTGSHGAEGLEIIEDVRERAPWTRIILLTAYGSPEVEAEAQRRGADAFLQKPTPLPHIAKIVLDLLGSGESTP
jgi:CheY-like chemotaxis protein